MLHKKPFLGFYVYPGAFLSHLARKADLQTRMVNTCAICTRALLVACFAFRLPQSPCMFIAFYFASTCPLIFHFNLVFHCRCYEKDAPRICRKHNSRDRHTQTWTSTISFQTVVACIIECVLAPLFGCCPFIAAMLGCILCLQVCFM